MNAKQERAYPIEVPSDTVSPIQDRCPVCNTAWLDVGTSPVVLRLARGHQTWAKCPRCRSFFAAEPYNFEDLVGHIRTLAWAKVETGFSLGEVKEPLFDAILRVLRNVTPRGSRLLDFGCSYGNFLERARNEGYRVRGFDIVPEAVEYVRSRGILCDRAASVADLDISDNSQDVISVLDCNCYWPNQLCELRAIRARLRPGGILAMRVVDTSWAIRIALEMARLFPAAGRKLFAQAVYDHRVSVPIHSLLQIVREEGFSTIYTSVRDAVPVRHHNLKALASYTIGNVSWRLARINLAPGVVFLARKDCS